MDICKCNISETQNGWKSCLHVRKDGFSLRVYAATWESMCVSECVCEWKWVCVNVCMSESVCVCPCSTSWNLNQALCPSLATSLICLNKPTSWAHQALLNHSLSLSLSFNTFLSVMLDGLHLMKSFWLRTPSGRTRELNAITLTPKFAPHFSDCCWLLLHCVFFVVFFVFLFFQLLCFSKNIFIEPQ